MTSTITFNPAASTSMLEVQGVAPAASNASPGLRRVVPTFISADELIFWTRKWREGEAESTAAREAGDVREFETGREAVRWLLSEDD